MSNDTSYLDQFEKDLNGWKNFDPARGYSWTNDGPIKVIQYPAPNIRKDFLYKLHWPFFGPLSDVQVWETLSNNEYTLDQMHIGIRPVEDRMNHIECNYDNDEERWKGPEDLVLNNSKESPITLKAFVAAVHEYFNDTRNKHMIRECINMFYTGPPRHHGGYLYSVSVEADGTWPPRNKIPEGMMFFFKDVQHAGADEGEWRMTLNIFSEGEFGTSLEKFLEEQRKWQKPYELGRQDYDV